MVRIVLVSHGRLAEELLRTAEAILGPKSAVAVLGLGMDESPEAFGERLHAAISFDDSEDTLVLADLWGGTPFNVACALPVPSGKKYAVVGGVNLAMLVEALSRSDREISLEALLESVVRAGIAQIREFIRPFERK